jgi:hypothetical protein
MKDEWDVERTIVNVTEYEINKFKKEMVKIKIYKIYFKKLMVD